MDSVPFSFECSACGRAPTAAGWGLCALCGAFFCREHLVTKTGIATCDECATELDRREASSAVSTSDEERVISLLRADVQAKTTDPVATLGTLSKRQHLRPTALLDRRLADRASSSRIEGRSRGVPKCRS